MFPVNRQNFEGKLERNFKGKLKNNLNDKDLVGESDWKLSRGIIAAVPGESA